ncbi:methylenetetrahydrofolate reductase [Desulfobulbus alkaliphilus]|uniref:methylenetetrahydrofolate reductase n=1 Tax=Desulfobulbus alkaliphilus TaxID=869814 RepID=UPI00196452F3|nr:methylenetetrahydrofolate reductase [Desulfobulbus alkaliphilus]MBM9538554.1 methylenetetrahydrofolate reductase [Desulfobulbus alkaliphilus]
MHIDRMINQKPPFLSLEFFPPKEEKDWETFFGRVEKLRALSPLFVSITCGAGGTSKTNTLEIASRLQNEMGLETMAHLTCLGGNKEDINHSLEQLRASEVNNVLALRGDPPKEGATSLTQPDFTYAADLVSYIREHAPDMGIGVAGYPEAHPESSSIAVDRRHMKEKLDRGADFLVTQFVFDNRVYFEFIERMRELGVTQPIIPGVLPVLSLKSVRYILSLSGASVPGRFYLQLQEAHERGGVAEVRRLGIAFAREQVRGLLEGGAPGVHLYTLNQADPCLQIAEGIF